VKPSEAEQFVYILHAGGFIKVGRAGNVLTRIKQLQCGCPSKIEPVVSFGKLPPSQAGDVEKCIHHRLRRVQSQGEWFSCSPEQAMTLLAAICVSFVGVGFFTHGNKYNELVRKCVNREHAARGWLDRSLRDAAAAEVDALLSQFPSPEEELVAAVESIPPIRIA
jgi:hypothetical protein